MRAGAIWNSLFACTSIDLLHQRRRQTLKGELKKGTQNIPCSIPKRLSNFIEAKERKREKKILGLTGAWTQDLIHVDAIKQSQSMNSLWMSVLERGDNHHVSYTTELYFLLVRVFWLVGGVSIHQAVWLILEDNSLSCYMRRQWHKGGCLGSESERRNNSLNFWRRAILPYSKQCLAAKPHCENPIKQSLKEN